MLASQPHVLRPGNREHVCKTEGQGQNRWGCRKPGELVKKELKKWWNITFSFSVRSSTETNLSDINPLTSPTTLNTTPALFRLSG
jgi:hypothetical protein